MDKVSDKLTVYFENPFWIGVFERIDGGKLSVAKVTFGAEPKDYEIQEFVAKHYYHLKFSPSVDVAVKQDATNPKRRQREARKQSLVIGIGTKSQQALQLQREENKLERKVISREMKEAEKERQFDLKQQKRKGARGPVDLGFAPTEVERRPSTGDVEFSASGTMRECCTSCMVFFQYNNE